MPMQRTLKKDFFRTWSSDMAYVLGFFAADGSMVKNKRGACFIEFQITDRALLIQIKKTLGASHKIASRVRNVLWKTNYRLQIGSKEMFQDLTNLGFTQAKSKTLHLPKVPKKYLPDFVRGYFDGDGCVYFKKLKVKSRKKPKWIFSSRFTSGSKEFLMQLHVVLRPCGVKGGFIVNKTRGYELVFSHRDSLALYGLMYNNSQSLYLLRKYKLFTKAIETLWGRSSAG